jgi:hypothetical protein
MHPIAAKLYGDTVGCFDSNEETLTGRVKREMKNINKKLFHCL